MKNTKELHIFTTTNTKISPTSYKNLQKYVSAYMDSNSTEKKGCREQILKLKTRMHYNEFSYEKEIVLGL